MIESVLRMNINRHSDIHEIIKCRHTVRRKVYTSMRTCILVNGSGKF